MEEAEPLLLLLLWCRPRRRAIDGAWDVRGCVREKREEEGGRFIHVATCVVPSCLVIKSQSKVTCSPFFPSSARPFPLPLLPLPRVFLSRPPSSDVDPKTASRSRRSLTLRPSVCAFAVSGLCFKQTGLSTPGCGGSCSSHNQTIYGQTGLEMEGMRGEIWPASPRCSLPRANYPAKPASRDDDVEGQLRWPIGNHCVCSSSIL